MKRWKTPKKRKRLGDIIENALKPLVELSDKHLGTDLKNCKGCQKRKEFLNKLSGE